MTRVTSLFQHLAARLHAASPRDKRLLKGLAAVSGLIILALLVAPALRTWRQADVRLLELQTQLAEMQELAAQTQTLRARGDIGSASSATALTAATLRLGEKAQLALQGGQARLTLRDVSLSDLGQCLQEIRALARARPIEMQLDRSKSGYSGTLVLSLPQDKS